MTPAPLLAGLVIATMLASPVLADDLVWQLYRDDGAGGTLVAIAQGELESPEPFWPFMVRCAPGEESRVTVSDVDAAALGAAISAGDVAMFSFVVNGRSDDRFPGYFPTITFGEMYGVWEYSQPIDATSLRDLGNAESLAIAGTGVELALPSEGLHAAFAGMADICASVEGGG